MPIYSFFGDLFYFLFALLSCAGFGFVLIDSSRHQNILSAAGHRRGGSRGLAGRVHNTALHVLPFRLHRNGQNALSRSWRSRWRGEKSVCYIRQKK